MTKYLRRLVSIALITLVVTGLAIVGSGADAFSGFQRRASDALFPSAKTSPEIVVVGMDDEFVRRYGAFPPRSVHALLARQFAAAGVRVAVWDVLFSPAREFDDELATALADLPSVVLAAIAESRPSPSDETLFDVTSFEASVPLLIEQPSVTVGVTEVKADRADGVVRSLPLVVDRNGTLLPALSVAALRELAGEQGPVLIRPDGIQVAGRFIPTEGRHALRLNWTAGLDPDDDSKRVISAIDVVDGTISPERLQGKVVFVGATDPTLKDTFPVPTDKSNTFPGVLIHANSLNTMLTSSYLAEASTTTTALWVALLAALVAFVVLFLPVWLSAVLTFVIAVGFLLVSFVRFDAGQILNVVYGLAAMAVSFVLALAVRYATETRKRRRVSSLFAQYVPEEVARQLEESGHLEEHMSGQRLDTSCLFCDLRGFTSMSATLEPAGVRKMLNAFYELTTQIILESGGTVLKFVGDEVFAVWGAPLPVEDHPQVSLTCAMEIQRRVAELDEELEDLHLPPIAFGIGMNSGDVVAAHVGGGKRRQYDIVGDTVNLASRLCGQAGKGEIVIPESMRDRLSDAPEMGSMGAIALKGLEEPVPLYKVVVDPSRAEARVPTVK